MGPASFVHRFDLAREVYDDTRGSVLYGPLILNLERTRAEIA